MSTTDSENAPAIPANAPAAFFRLLTEDHDFVPAGSFLMVYPTVPSKQPPENWYFVVRWANEETGAHGLVGIVDQGWLDKKPVAGHKVSQEVFETALKEVMLRMRPTGCATCKPKPGQVPVRPTQTTKPPVQTTRTPLTPTMPPGAGTVKPPVKADGQGPGGVKAPAP